MATAVKKTATLSKPQTNGKVKKQSETPLKLTKKQREILETHENAAKIISRLIKEGKMKPYQKSY